MPGLLEITDLRVDFHASRGVINALNGVNLAVEAGTIMGLVGETGAGKSITAYSILRLVPPPGRIVEGQIKLGGRDLMQLTEKEMGAVRGREISVVFQNPRESLNPVLTMGEQLYLVLHARQGLSRKASRPVIEKLLNDVQLPRPSQILPAYPHELSGGMCQRVMIALALASSPRLLIADEATTKLDVTIQYQIICLLKSLKEEKGLTEIVITHDLGIVAELCQSVAVMYCGEVVELAPVADFFRSPLHPYSIGLLESRPRMSMAQLPKAMPGESPNLLKLPSGCLFNPRCSQVREICREVRPSYIQTQPQHWVKCNLYGES